MTMKRIFTFKLCLISSLLVLFTDCKDLITNSDNLNLNTIKIDLNKAEYRKDEIAELSILNNSATDLILIHCALQPGFDIEKKVDGNWVLPYLIDCAAIGVPFQISKYSTFKHSIHFPLFENELDSVKGVYRLKLWLQEAQNRNLIADSLRVTNSFRIIE